MIAAGRRVDPDHPAAGVGQRPPGVARPDVGAGLHHAAQRLAQARVLVGGDDGAVQAADHPGRDRRRSTLPALVADGQDGRAHLHLRGSADRDRPEPRRPLHLEQGDVVGAVVAHDPRRIAPARRHRRDRDAGRTVDDVVVGQDQPGRGVDDEARALRRFLQVPQVGGHVHHAGLDRLVDGLVVHRVVPVRGGVARHSGAARTGRGEVLHQSAWRRPRPRRTGPPPPGTSATPGTGRGARPIWGSRWANRGITVPAVALVHPTALLPGIDPRQ